MKTLRHVALYDNIQLLTNECVTRLILGIENDLSVNSVFILISRHYHSWGK